MADEQTSVARRIVDHLVDRGCRYIFVGPATNHQFAFINALYERRHELQPILVRHEAMAPLMAEGWYRVTHRPGIFHVGAGPALANSVLGVMSAYTCGSAVIGISGQVNTRFWGRNGMQEVQGQTYAEGHRILEPVLKRYWQVSHPYKVGEVLNQAFSTAQSGRPGPVLIDIPMDVFEMNCDKDEFTPPPQDTVGRPAGDPKHVGRAVELLKAAKRPVLLCGGGVILSEATEEVLRLAEVLRLPVVTSLTGKGAIPDDHPLAAGPIGAMGVEPAMRLVREADVLLSLGFRFGEHSTSGWTRALPFAIPPTKLIQVDIEPVEIGRYFPVEVGIQGDIKNVLAQMLDAAHMESEANASERPSIAQLATDREVHRAARRERAAADTGLVNPHRLVAELRAQLSRDSILLPDAGNNGNFFNSDWDVFEPQTYIVDRGSAAMGYAPAAALGVQLAAPTKQVVVVTGDGCMTQVNWVLGTAREYGIPVKFIVLNDGALGGCVSVQESVFGGRMLCTTFQDHNTGEPLLQDFAKLAESYGVAGSMVSSNSELSDAISQLLAHEGPCLLDTRIDPHARPRGAGRMTVSTTGSLVQSTPVRDTSGKS